MREHSDAVVIGAGHNSLACAAHLSAKGWRVAVFVQVATNYANDYSDGKRGTDDPTKRVGPPRLVGNGLATAAEVKVAMVLTFLVAGVAGGMLALRVGWELVPAGVAAIAAGYFYTGGPKPYGYLGLGEAFVRQSGCGHQHGREDQGRGEPERAEVRR